MGAYAYCQSCELPLPNPTLGDALAGSQDCPHCRTQRLLRDDERRWVGDELMERLNPLLEEDDDED